VAGASCPSPSKERPAPSLAFRQQAVDEGLAKLHQQPQMVSFLIQRTQRGKELEPDGIRLRLLDPVFQFQFRQPVPRSLYQALIKLDLRLLENHKPGGDILNFSVSAFQLFRICLRVAPAMPV